MISGRESWAQGHVPGAGFADLIEESDFESPLPFMLPGPRRFAEAMSRLAVGSGRPLVAADGESGMWAARLWWMLRVFGFDAVSVLDGGLRAWTAQGLPLTTEPPDHPASRFEPSLRPELIATRDRVEAGLADGATCLVNALDPGTLPRRSADRRRTRGAHPRNVTSRHAGSSTRRRAAPCLSTACASASPCPRARSRIAGS